MSIIAESGLLDRVDGSSSYELGSTKVISSVTGPIETSRMKNEQPTKAYLDINITPSAGVATTREAFLETKLHTILAPLINLNQYPRQTIQIAVQIIKDGESKDHTTKELVAIVNSVYLSLLNSGVPLKSSFLSTCCCISQANRIIMNPSSNELEASKSHHIAVFTLKNAITDELMFCDSLGSFSESQLFEVLDHCATDIELKNSKLREIVANRIEKDYVWKF